MTTPAAEFAFQMHIENSGLIVVIIIGGIILIIIFITGESIELARFGIALFEISSCQLPSAISCFVPV